MNNSTPIWGPDNILFITSAYDQGSRAIRLNRKADTTAVDELWFTNRFRLMFTNGIRLGNHLYGTSGDFGPAFLGALDVRTGEVAWQERGFSRANLVHADGTLLILDEDGQLALVEEPEELADWLEDTADRIEAITGEEPCRLFRPHAGWRSGTMYDGLDQAGFRLAGWSWGMWDWDWWRDPNAERVATKLLKKASPGDIIVIHDGHHKNPAADRSHAGQTVARLAPQLRQKGYQFGMLCDPDTNGAPLVTARR